LTTYPFQETLCFAKSVYVSYDLAVDTDYFLVQHSASSVFSVRYELQCYERVRAEMKLQLTLRKFKADSRNGKSGGKNRAMPFFKRRKSPEFSLSF